MDNVESGPNQPEEVIEFKKVKVFVSLKDGDNIILEVHTPIESPMYDVPITEDSIHAIITQAYSLGESPVLALPTGPKKVTYIDLSAANYVTVSSDG